MKAQPRNCLLASHRWQEEPSPVAVFAAAAAEQCAKNPAAPPPAPLIPRRRHVTMTRGHVAGNQTRDPLPRLAAPRGVQGATDADVVP
ncbi:unnamed protein product [Lampetra planeri]